MRRLPPVLARLSIIALLLGVLTGAPVTAAPAPGVETDPAARAQALLATMSQDEKIGQVLWTHVYGSSAQDETYADKNEDVFGPGVRTPAQAVSTFHLGGVLYFNWAHNVTTPTDPGQVAALSDGLQEAARTSGPKIPLAITIDQEGGLVARVRTSGTDVPGNMALGATGSTELARAQGQALGSELAAMGINVDFAPVLDVNTNAANPVIGVRSLGDDPEAVASLGAAQIEGLQSEGVSATAKYFPGHGDTQTDSHLGLPTVSYDRATLDTHLAPFRAAVKGGVDMIMTAHIVVEAIDPAHPATTSKAVLTDLLREEMGFTGLITTDAMDMEGVQLSVMSDQEKEEYARLKADQDAKKDAAAKDPTAADQYTAASAALKAFLAPVRGRVAVQSFLAGSDVLLNTYDVPAVTSAMKAALADGTITAERLDASVTRILEWKARRGVLDASPTSAQTIASVVGSAAHQETAARIAQQSVTMVRNDADSVLPLSPTRTPRLLLTGSSWGNPELLTQPLTDLGFTVNRVETSGDSPDPTAAEVDEALAQAENADAIVLTTYSMAAGSTQADLVARMVATGKPVTILSTRNPYDVAVAGTVAPAAGSTGQCLLPAGCSVTTTPSPTNGVAVLNLYSNRQVSLTAAAKVIAGQAPVGVLPVNVPTAQGGGTLQARGFGLTYPSQGQNPGGGQLVPGVQPGIPTVPDPGAPGTGTLPTGSTAPVVAEPQGTGSRHGLSRTGAVVWPGLAAAVLLVGGIMLVRARRRRRA